MSTPRMSALLRDARAAGYEIVEAPGSDVRIFKAHKGHGGILRGIIVYDDGTAFDLRVRADVARGMRSFADMREVLHLPKEGAEGHRGQPGGGARSRVGRGAGARVLGRAGEE